ncbi:hypothetical protein CK203_082616 [Vitis vinifera]|uniref:Uncharacterized protein n=1 Tax=Vitis vinifera TaxID=29760 RepID=A0A438CL44_VITVI|nr:hypothetical protein CK203_082616 [Vitis vinifera]
MEEEAQKMMALKKAYAEIILNTSKEAAARIMASERKALRFQQDLCCLKDEALRMLLRLRQMIDFQTTEAETTSLRQRSRIEELEAQLHEAEDIIADLRVELKETKGELQKMRNKEVQPLNGQLPKVDATSPENGTYNDRLNTTELMSASPSDSGFEILPTSDIKDTPMHQRVLDNMGCNTTRQTESSSDSHLDNYYADNPDLAPIIMRSKEPELYRNGRTQRIRALESNLLNGELPHEDTADQYSLIKNEPVIEADGKGEGLHTVPSFKAKNMDRMKNLAELEDGKQLSGSSNEDQPVKVIWRLRRRRTRYGTRKTTSRKPFPHQLMKSSQPSPVLSHCKTYSDSVTDRVKSGEGACTVSSPKGDDMDYVKNYTEWDKKCSIMASVTKIKILNLRTEDTQKRFSSNVKSGEEQLQIAENEAKMKPPTRLNPGLTLIKTDIDPISGSVNVTLSVKDVNKSGAVQIAANDDTELADEHMSVKKEGDAAGSSRLLSCKLNLEMVDAQSVNSDSIDTNASEAANGSPSQGDNNRLLKYTFQRKRKKESLNNPDENSSPEKSTIKRRAMRKQNGAPEGQKSNLINQSSRDSRRLAQVARQVGDPFPSQDSQMCLDFSFVVQHRWIWKHYMGKRTGFDPVSCCLLQGLSPSSICN